MPRLEGESALVTGGAAGLGRAIAQRLAADGASVTISDVRRDDGHATAQELGLDFVEQDVTDEGRWSEVVQAVEQRHGRLSILVNNAGVIAPAATAGLEDARLADWRRVFSVNVDGVFLGCRAALPALRRAGGGAIVNMSSVAGLSATPEDVAYGASKAAVWEFTKSVAKHCVQHELGVRCNSVHPGAVRTGLWDSAAEEEARRRGISLDAVIDETMRGLPMGDFSLPEDIAAAVAFLVSGDARRITGLALIVDGGSITLR